MSGLDVAKVTRRFGRTLALDDVSLSLGPGEILAVLGASGCGKSTLLRLIAGLDVADSGEIAVGDRRVAGRGCHEPPETRGVGLMFQDYALFPHLTVLANVRFGLAHLPGAEARRVAEERLAQVGLAHRADSYPGTLSGGEAQRVALARALAPRPRVLLLDEPFSNLDAGTREHVRADTLAVLRRDGIGAILVTHDSAEAIAFADRIALMHRGRVVQCDSPERLYDAPRSPFAARALGDIIEIPGQAVDGLVTTALGPLPRPASMPDGAVRVCLRPEAIRLGPVGEGVTATVLGRAFAGAHLRLDLVVAGRDAPLRLHVPPEAAPGDRVGIHLLPARAYIFAETPPGERISTI
ncbi:ABC transporter ATP-binding protein [Methylobacterium sp. Leaf118]|uniref:ABC transporter ATP-binding protein n=1 Tax=Methylobacterium sp. Leaf118 TaxID=2876562 RepID=UPI001E4D387E|nr:ABC transporter ATP-binding protein [Methylobacterium sp. Leaf118]